MTFAQWLKDNPKVAELSPSELRLVELGWIAGRLAAHSDRLDAALEREAA